MKKVIILFFSILIGISSISTIEFNSVDAAKTGSYNFCTQFPAFPECSSWRTEPISDNYWFCQYVYLKDLCNTAPNPENRIPLKTENDCCQYIGPELEKTMTNRINPTEIKNNVLPKDTIESELPLIIWTDKDHYNYGDKVIVYGKFDFTDQTIIENIDETNFLQTGEVSEIKFTVDFKLNGREVLRDISISPNGWFSSFFFLDNPYRFSTQNNVLEVEYIISSADVPLGGPKTHATYKFTTGEISPKDENFKLWIDDSALPHKIEYGVIVENPERFIEHGYHNFVKTRITTPDGYIIPIKSVFSIQDLATEYSGFSEYGNGTYKIQITYGNNTATQTFEYTN